jgi:hypothetical protein
MACHLKRARPRRTLEKHHMQVHILSIDKLIPHHRNLRKNDHAVDWMVASIQQFGSKIPTLARSSGEVEHWHQKMMRLRRRTA